ncbi:MAG: GNAT family N-acetyltransferase [Alphaproteobacteria bacterium]|nr:GNAT family N-acetyltransferase [Alphaproteobacteria bacterium]
MKKDIFIREVETIADCESLSLLAEKLAHHHGDNLKPDPERLIRDCDWFSARIASADEVDVGFIGWHRAYACQSAMRSIELQNLYVDPKYRGLCIGSRLVYELVKEALRCVADIKLAVMKNNPGALEFYKKLGFETSDCNAFWRCRWKEDDMRKFECWGRSKFE